MESNTIKLYTCSDGIKLFTQGRVMATWDEDEFDPSEDFEIIVDVDFYEDDMYGSVYPEGVKAVCGYEV